MSRLTRAVVAALFSLTIWLPVALAQDAQDTGDTATAAKKLDKATKRKMKQTLKELDNAYKQWLTEDVVYIITPEERNAFLQLQTNEEREQFIEQFWLRRSSNPDLPD
ncbi:MAG TPA: GWxTD domain-containing protein, partial [Candidatus Acidoferrum sp.]